MAKFQHIGTKDKHYRAAFRSHRSEAVSRVKHRTHTGAKEYGARVAKRWIKGVMFANRKKNEEAMLNAKVQLGVAVEE